MLAAAAELSMQQLENSVSLATWCRLLPVGFFQKRMERGKNGNKMKQNGLTMMALVSAVFKFLSWPSHTLRKLLRTTPEKLLI